MAVKRGLQKDFNKKFWLGAGVTLLVLALFFSLREDPTYHKISRLEYLTNRLLYSADQYLAQVLSFRGEDHFFLSMPYYLQENGLTCEVAALRTALGYLGSYVSEEELLGKLAFDTKEPISPQGIWGDPEKGFVGDINGSVFLRTGFGVYEKPIRDLALNYRRAAVIEKANLAKVLREVVSGNPVIAWGLLSKRTPISWRTEDGEVIEVQPGEHARVVIGFTGKIDNPKEIILIDPIYGMIRINKGKFVSDWAVMDNRAVVVYK